MNSCSPVYTWKVIQHPSNSPYRHEHQIEKNQCPTTISEPIRMEPILRWYLLMEIRPETSEQWYHYMEVQ